MTKKLIAVLIAATVVFMCVFASCNDNTNVNKQTGKEYEYVTDENGNPVLDENGDLYVYVTDANGKKVTNSDGEPETLIQAFDSPIQDDKAAEYYSYKITLPEGWKATDGEGGFQNKSKKTIATIDVVKYLYNDYYNLNKDTYDTLTKQLGDQVELKWQEGLYLVPSSFKTCRFILKSEEGVRVLVFFEHSNNVYKILFESENRDIDAVLDISTEFCKAIELKPYQVWEDVTAKPTEATTNAE